MQRTAGTTMWNSVVWLPLNTASVKAAAGQSHFHESARAQVAGAVNYIDDIPEVKGTLFAAPILSNVAHGRLLGVDATAALAMPGVRGPAQC